MNLLLRLFCCAVVVFFFACGEEGGVNLGTGNGGAATNGNGSESDDGRTTGAGTGDGGDTNTNTTTQPTECIDEAYEEVLPDLSQSIDALIAAYQPAQYRQFIFDVLDTRYPIGSYIVDAGLDDPTRDCVDSFVGDVGSAQSVLGSIGTVVHECGHILDWYLTSDFNDDVYLLRDDLQFDCEAGDTVTRNGNTFARSRINNDSYSQLRPPCNGASSSSCDFYADVYLDGDPDDGQFDSGDQGYNLLLEEAVQYVNSLATGYAISDRYPPQGWSITERDGILTMLWYVTRYLRFGRLNYPGAYAFIRDDECFRQATLTMWGRAWLYLNATEGMSGLGINDGKLYELVMDPELLDEIELLRQAEGCE